MTTKEKTKQGDVREYFESGLCADLSQEDCSGCALTRMDGDYCEKIHEIITSILKDLSGLGVVIKVEGEMPSLLHAPLNGFRKYTASDVRRKVRRGRNDMLEAGYTKTIPLIEEK